MLTYQQLVSYLQSGKSQLKAFQTFRNELISAKTHLNRLQREWESSRYRETIKLLINWLDGFIADTEHKEAVLIHNVEYINRRLAIYPTIEIDIEEATSNLN